MSGYVNDPQAVNPTPARNKTSTVTIILGAVIFVALAIGLMIRRLWLLRRFREAGRRAAWLEVLNGIGGEDGPVTIAIGGRAVNVRRPTFKEIWVEEDNNNLSKGYINPSSNYSWSSVKPMALQLTTPHTVAIPSDPTNPGNPLVYGSTPNPRSPRSPLHQTPAPQVFQSYNPILLQPKPTNNRSTTTTTTATKSKSTTNVNLPGVPNKENDDDITSGYLSSHPLLTSVLIKLPDEQSPTYLPSSHSSHSRFRSRKEKEEKPEGWLPTLELGTLFEPVLLPSFTIPRKELEKWWDVPLLMGVNSTSGHLRVAGDPYEAAINAAIARSANMEIGLDDVNPRAMGSA